MSWLSDGDVFIEDQSAIDLNGDQFLTWLHGVLSDSGGCAIDLYDYLLAHGISNCHVDYALCGDRCCARYWGWGHGDGEGDGGSGEGCGGSLGSGDGCCADGEC